MMLLVGEFTFLLVANTLFPEEQLNKEFNFIQMYRELNLKYIIAFLS